MTKSVLITGASDRVGKAFALALAEKGYHCIIHYNSSAEKAERTKKEVEAAGGQCTLLQAGFTDEKAVEALLDKVPGNIHLDILINCASMFIESSIHDEGYGLLDKLMKINFKAPYILTKKYAEKYKTGLIVNILDTKVAGNYTKHLDYLLTKKLLKDFTLISATQLGPDIRVNGIAPGIILPPPGKDETYTDKLAQGIPLKQSGNPGELVKALNYLIDADFVTGQIIYVDGGEHL